eukprot:scaffold4516_cov417-Prasinococcus_capsulatus_cf.AAC.25
MTKEWAAKVVQGWEDWIDEAARTGDLIGEAALGAGTGQVLAVDTTSVNLYQLCYAAVSHAQRSSGGRSVIITDVANFPTDRYVLQGLAKQLHCRLVLIDDSEGHEFVTPESLHATISEVGAQTVALQINGRGRAVRAVASASVAHSLVEYTCTVCVRALKVWGPARCRTAYHNSEGCRCYARMGRKSRCWPHRPTLGRLGCRFGGWMHVQVRAFTYCATRESDPSTSPIALLSITADTAMQGLVPQGGST